MWRIKTKACSSIIIPALILVAIAMPVTAVADQPVNLKSCEAIKNDNVRLKCYDEAAQNDERSGVYGGGELGAKPLEGVAPPTLLSRRWELESATKNGTWVMQPYNQVFILPARYTDRTNDQPTSPTPSHTFPQPVPLNHTEAEFQISFKVKAVENIWDKADLYFAYTQQSQWQVYASSISRPFRETNYMPEVFLVMPTNYNLLGLTGRFVQFSFVHQSNGRADPLSRSWNRAYANFGFERGNFALYVRPWYRFKEKVEDDDNPDIHRYMGYGDLTGIYKWGRQEFSLLGRYNTSTSKGALQATWSFPIQGRLQGFVKFFEGYGETLIDYNWRQTTIGAGIDLVRWL